MTVAPRRIGCVVGTRPEGIKVAPLILALAASDAFDPVVISTGQHREMLQQVLDVFDILPDIELDVLTPGQSLADVTTAVVGRLTPILAELELDALVVQGDTTTTFAAALAASYTHIPVVHLEAGLRTGNRSSPFPEELNRRMTTHLAELHLAPTAAAAANLVAEGIERTSVAVTGNTVIDALAFTLGTDDADDPDLCRRLTADPRRMVLVTAHRRESWGAPMEAIGTALATLAGDRDDVVVLFPIHRNPIVRDAIEPRVAESDNVILTEPLGYGTFCRMMRRADVILTDSGGVQEEAPSLGRPVLVMRENTERPEAVDAGTARLVGTDAERVVAEVGRLLDDPDEYASMATAVNPYGDGQAVPRCLTALRRFFGEPVDVSEFDPDSTSG